MAKKGKGSGASVGQQQQQQAKSKPLSIPNRELLQRMNFLQQASVLVSNAIYNPEAAARAARQRRQRTEGNVGRQDGQDGTVADAPYNRKIGPEGPITRSEREKREAAERMLSDLLAPGGLLDTQPNAASNTSAPAAHVNTDWSSQWPAVKPQTRSAVSKSKSKSASARLSDEKRRYIEALKHHHRHSAYRKKLAKSGLTESQIKLRLAKEDEERFWRAHNTADSRITPPLALGHALPQRRAEIMWQFKPLAGPEESRAHPAQLLSRNLASRYVSDIKTIARKSVLRLDPVVKRTMCRNCDAMLIPGVTSSVKILPSKTHVHLIRTRCLACMVSRTIPAPPLLPSESEKSSREEKKPAHIARNKDVEAATASGAPTKATGIANEEGMQTDSAELTEEETSSRTLSEQGLPPNPSTSTSASVSRITPASASVSGTTTPADASASAQDMQTENEAKSSVDSSIARIKRANKRRKASMKRKLKHEATPPAENAAQGQFGRVVSKKAKPMVPGKKLQYGKVRFHDLPQHFVTIGNENKRVQI